jgi:hypothetical protein
VKELMHDVRRMKEQHYTAIFMQVFTVFSDFRKNVFFPFISVTVYQKPGPHYFAYVTHAVLTADG